MLQKRWSVLVLSNLFSIGLCLLVMFCLVSYRKGLSLEFLGQGREFYVGAALPTDLLTSDEEENREKAKAFFINDGNDRLWQHFHTAVLEEAGYTVFVFKTSGAASAQEKVAMK